MFEIEISFVYLI